MYDLIEVFANKIAQIIISALALECGASLWQGRKFSKKRLLGIVLILLGIRFALRFFG
jgi:uncharacterized membrane protein YdcZ (DUF606 family)